MLVSSPDNGIIISFFLWLVTSFTVFFFPSLWVSRGTLELHMGRHSTQHSWGHRRYINQLWDVSDNPERHGDEGKHSV